MSMLEPGGFKTRIIDPQSIEKQITRGWHELSTELKEEYGEEFLKRGIEPAVFFTGHRSQVTGCSKNSCGTENVLDPLKHSLTTKT